jgi:excisionase family DNA binding protein
MDRLAAQLDRIDTGPTPLVYTAEEAGTVLGVSEDTVRRWVRAGHLPRLPHTDRLLIPRKAVEGFVQAATSRALGHQSSPASLTRRSGPEPAMADNRSG